MVHDFKGIGCSKIGYFKEVRKKLKELEKLNLKLAQRRNRLEAISKHQRWVVDFGPRFEYSFRQPRPGNHVS